MSEENISTAFPIRELVLRTGVNASTLRAWENRHGLLTPMRTPSGHRLYSQQDVLRVRRLQAYLSEGLSLNEIAPLLDQPPQLRSIGVHGTSAGLPATATAGIATSKTYSATSDATSSSMAATAQIPGPAWQGYLQETLLGIEDFSTQRLDTLYNEACAIYPIEVVTDNLLIPVLTSLGQRWDSRATGIAEEHFFSAWLRNKLGARLHHASTASSGPALVMACLPNEQHEIGLLVFALAALQRGYRVIYLGANMPIRQLLHVARHTQALGVVLAGRSVADVALALQDIAYLSSALAVPVFVGSHFSLQVQADILAAGATPLGDAMTSGLSAIDAQLARLAAVVGHR